eukprot:767942-Hanusia_phi.AAC.1
MQAELSKSVSTSYLRSLYHSLSLAARGPYPCMATQRPNEDMQAVQGEGRVQVRVRGWGSGRGTRVWNVAYRIGGLSGGKAEG